MLILCHKTNIIRIKNLNFIDITDNDNTILNPAFLVLNRIILLLCLEFNPNIFENAWVEFLENFLTNIQQYNIFLVKLQTHLKDNLKQQRPN